MMSILSNKKGRLLTPDEGCGYSKVAHKRIVGGTVAKDGELYGLVKSTFFSFHLN